MMVWGEGMDEITFVIAEGLKGLNNAAVDLVMKGDLDEAERVFESIENTAKMFQYNDGVGAARVSMANLSMMRGDIIQALTHIEIAVEKCSGSNKEEACAMQKKVSMIALQKGMEKEKEGELKGALELFERILPHMNEKRAAAVSKEIESIKAYLKDTKG